MFWIDPQYAREIDESDYVAGYRQGRSGKPDPMGNATYAMWLGWLHGANVGGFLDRAGPFARIIDARLSQ